MAGKRLRDRLDILIEILKFCDSSKLFFDIRSDLNLNGNQLKKHLEFLLYLDFIIITAHFEKWETTEKGKIFLKLLKKEIPVIKNI